MTHARRPGAARTAPGDTAAPGPGSSADGALARVARGGALGGAGAAVNAVLSFVVVIAVTRGFSAAEAGSLFAATSVFLIVVAIVELGVDTGLLHWMPRYEVAGQWRSLRACLLAALVPTAAAGLAGAGLLLLLGSAVTGVASGGGSSDTTAHMLRAMALFVPVAAMHDVVLAVTRAYRTMRPTVLIERVARSVLQVGAVVAAYAAGASGSWLAAAWTAPYLPSLAASVWWARRLHRRHAGPPPAGDQPSLRAVARDFWGYTLPRAGARICQVALQRADIVLVAALRSPKEAAVYTAATRFLVLGLLGVQAVQQVMQPHLSHALARGDRPAAGRLFRVSTVWIVAATFPAYLLMIGYAPLALRVFGSSYSGGETVLVLLALSMLFASAAGPVDVVLTMGGRSGLSLANSVVALAVDIGLDLVLIPPLGITGAAIGWSAAIVVRNVLPLLQVRRLMGLTAASPGLWLVIRYAVLCFGAGPVLYHLAGERVAVALAPVLTGAYCWLLWRERERTDLALLGRSLLRRRSRAVAPAAPATLSGRP